MLEEKEKAPCTAATMQGARKRISYSKYNGFPWECRNKIWIKTECYRYPNLVEERGNGAISTIADFVDTTEERIEGILAGKIVPAAFERKRLCAFYWNVPDGYLFHPVLQMMNPNKFQHREKMRRLLLRAEVAAAMIADPLEREFDLTAARRLAEKGLSRGITYADYRELCSCVTILEARAAKASRAQRVALRLAEEEAAVT